MSYKIHTTDAFIVTAKHSKDSDLSVLMFTADFGLIHAVAKSARLIKSKLRYSLQSLSYGNISLVKGREVWRVTSAKKLISLYDSRLPLGSRVLHARLLAYIERFCPREQPEPEIFGLIKCISSRIFSIKAAELQAGQVTYEHLEKIFLLKLLFELGYIEKTDVLTKYLESDISNIDPVTEKDIDKAIAHAITQSQL